MRSLHRVCLGLGLGMVLSACTSSNVGKACDKNEDCGGDGLVCDVHDGKGTCQEPHGHDAGADDTAHATEDTAHHATEDTSHHHATEDTAHHHTTGTTSHHDTEDTSHHDTEDTSHHDMEDTSHEH